MIALAVLVPLALLALCLGAGLALDRLSGERLPGALLVPAGLALAVLAGLLGALLGIGVPAVLAALAVLAAVGALVAWPWRFARPDPVPLATALGVYLALVVPLALAGRPAGGLRFELGLLWVFPSCLAFGAAAISLCLWQLAEALAARRLALAGAAALLALACAGPVWRDLLSGGAGVPSYDRLAELREAEGDFGAYAVSGDPDAVPLSSLLAHRTLAVRSSPPVSRPPAPYRRLRTGDYYDVWRRPAQPEGRPVLHHMPLGEGGAVAALPDCAEVGGLGLLALSGQLGLPGQSIAIVAAAPGGRYTVAVPPGEARRLCGHRWDWIEAVGRGG